MHGTDKAVAERHIKQAKAKEFVKQVQHALTLKSVVKDRCVCRDAT
mgnify:CR=1 FL=1